MTSEMLSSNPDHVNTLQYICTCVKYIDVVTVQLLFRFEFSV